MLEVSILEAGAQLSALIEVLESKKEDQIVIMRNGLPVARLLPLDVTIDTSNRIGVAKNVFSITDDIDMNNEEVKTLFSDPVG